MAPTTVRFAAPLQSAGALLVRRMLPGGGNAERILGGNRRRTPALEGGSHPQAPRHHLGARETGVWRLF